MNIQNSYLKIVLRVIALWLWYFTPLFLLIVVDGHFGNPIFTPGTGFGNMVVRHPYKWDFELMFAGLYLVWGIFLWRASSTPKQSREMILFTITVLYSQTVLMIIIGALRGSEFMHLFGDSLWYLVLGILLHLAFLKNKKLSQIC